MPKWRWIYKNLVKKLWFRILIFFMLGIVTAGLSYYLKQYIPPNIAEEVGADAVDNLLNIIATSMLAVTTFSLSIMISAYSSASTNATPRATKLLLEDGTTQNECCQGQQ